MTLLIECGKKLLTTYNILNLFYLNAMTLEQRY